MKPTLGQAQSNWEADKVLDVYIHDYFLKRRLHNTAKAFMAEGKVSTDPVAIDAPGGFLFEWWSVFWDIFISRTNEKHSEAAASYIETQQTKAREQPQMQQLQRMQQRNAQLQRRDPNHPGLGGSLNPMNSEGMLGQPPGGQLAMKMYEARMKHPHSLDANRMALLKSATSHQGQLVHGNSGNMSAVLQQMQARSALNNHIKGEVKIGASSMNFPMDSSVYRQSILQSRSGLGSAGLNQGVTCHPLKGWPLNGIEQLRPGLGVQVPRPNLTSQNQYLLASQQQQVLAQAQAQQNSLGNSNYGDMDPRRLSGLPQGSLNPKDGQSNWNDGSISSQMQSGSPKGIDRLRPGLGVQVPKPNLTSQNQYLLASQQQQVLAQAQAQQNSLGNSNYGDMDPRRLSGLPRGSLNPKDGQSNWNDGSISSQMQSGSPKGIDQLRPGLGVQVPKPNLTSQNQYLLASQQQQVLAQAQAQQNSLGNSNYGDMDPRRLSGLPRGSLNPKDGQSNWNDGSISSQMQSGSPKMKMAQTQQSLSQQQEQLQQHQLQQSNRKRKQASSSGAANITGTGTTAGPSPNSPSSTHTPGDALNAASSMQHVNNVQKSMMMYGTEATGGLGSSSNLLDDIDRFGDVGALDDNVESFLSNDSGDGGNLYGTIKQSPAEEQKESSKTYTFAEFSCIRTTNIVTSCHFSSDGKLLASAGEDKKVTLWNMDSLRTEHTPEEHKLVITDVRFRPNSSQLATASWDKYVRLWDAANPTYCVQEYSGHSSAIMSLDFHPKKTDIFCFCDSENEIRYYNITSSSCTRVSKGGNAKVRFQPGSGQLLAAASDKVVSIFDVETDRQIYSLQGHPEPVNNICWDTTGDMLASISPNLVKIWNLTSGECVQELNSTGNQFYSGLFHPSYATLLVVGGISSLELWNMAENKSMTIPAHENVISALAECAATGMVASASRDNSVKLWK